MRLSDADVGQVSTIQMVSHQPEIQDMLAPIGFSCGNEVCVKAKIRNYVVVGVGERQFVMGEELANKIII